MEIMLSKTKIDSFCGNVLPLRLLGVEPYSNEKIEWSSDSDIVSISSFSNVAPYFTDAVLLTLLKSGEAKIKCSFAGNDYICNINIHEMMHASSGKDLNYYVGDLHDHSYNDHKKDIFISRKEENYPKKYLQMVNEENLEDFTAITDHARLLNGIEYYRGFDDDDTTDHKNIVVFPGEEGDVSFTEADRFGIVCRNSGEVLTYNSTAITSARTWDAFFKLTDSAPFTICGFAHPQICGYTTAGIWNFDLSVNNTPRFTKLFRLIEMGDGSDRQSNLINEYMYSVALDNGFHISPTCSSDSHGPDWGYFTFPGKTIIMAPEKSKEAFIDAILNNRVYASSTGNVKLCYEVNGYVAPATVPESKKYHFDISVDYFQKKNVDRICFCQVISDQGKCLLNYECHDQNDFSFDIESKTAHYFYLRLIDRYGNKTWSCPVWTDRKPDEIDDTPIEPISKDGFTAIDIESGEDASVLVNNDPTKWWRSQKTTCTVVIDMHRKEKLCAFSNYPKLISQENVKAEGFIPPNILSFLPSEFRISTSLDNENYDIKYEGQFRVFGGEEIFRFEETEARYIKLEVLSSVGMASYRKAQFMNALIDLAELTVWKKKQ